MTGGTVTKAAGASYGELRTFGGTMTFDSPNSTAVIDSTVTFNLVGSATLNVSRGNTAKDLIIGAVILNSNSLTKSAQASRNLRAPTHTPPARPSPPARF